MTEVKNKHIVIAGAARSGVGAACLLKAHGADIFVTDSGPVSSSFMDRLEKNGIPFEQNGHSGKAYGADMLVVSPGVPSSSVIVERYKKESIQIYSELEVASWYCPGPMIAVTGTNGKTTTTSWLDHTWNTAGKSHVTAGNIGSAFSDAVGSLTADTDVILEVSSFQLDHIDLFRPHVAVLLNITPDHMNRYDNNLENYIAAKFRIFENQTGEDILIYCQDDPILHERLSPRINDLSFPRLWSFSNRQPVPEGAFVRGNEIIFNIRNKEEQIMQLEEISLKGQHNLHNGLATALAARASEIRNSAIRDSLMSFEGVEHRLELVRELEGVRYINDSKATNVNAVWYALDSFNVPMVLILGGRDKGNDYSELIEQIRKKVHTIVAIGESREKIRNELGEVVPNLCMAENMKEAVGLGKKWAKRGEIVLLSPACASFDMFDNYEHRGKEFKRWVNSL